LKKSAKQIFLLSLIGRGGTYHTAIQLSSALSNQCQTSIIIPSYSDTAGIDKKVNIMKITAPPNLFGTILASFNIVMHIRAIKVINASADIIDILDIHPWYVIWWPFLKASKKVVTINDPEQHSGEKGGFSGMIIRFATRFLLKRANTIIVLGKKQEHTVRKLGYTQKIIVSRIGNYAFLKRSKKICRTESRTILFFGRIKDYKGLQYLLDALIGITNKKFKLVIAGDGDLSLYRLQLERLGNHVEIHNTFMRDDAIAPFFERAAFVVLPYTEATQTGIVPIAYSFSKPVIATNVGSLPEVVINGKTGIIVEAKNTEQLRKAIMHLLSSPSTTKQLGKNGRQFMEEELDWKKIVKKLYDDIN